MRGLGLPQICDDLRGCVPGGMAHFLPAQTPKAMRERDEWLRECLPAGQLMQWRGETAAFRKLKRVGASDNPAARIAGNAERWRRNGATGLNLLSPIAYFDRLGVPPSLVTSTSRVAWCVDPHAGWCGRGLIGDDRSPSRFRAAVRGPFAVSFT